MTGQRQSPGGGEQSQFVVDGERFTVRRRPGLLAVYDIEWLSGPSPAYGFSVAAYEGGVAGTGSPELDDLDMEEAIREFLSDVGHRSAGQGDL